MSELNDKTAWTLNRTMQLLSDAKLTFNGSDIMQVAECLSDLSALYAAISDNSLQIVSVAQEAGPEPKEKADVAAD